jgi:hypothetical protein
MRGIVEQIVPGIKVVSPAGRSLIVQNVFVPKTNQGLAAKLPPRFRALSRKVVVFQDSSVMPLSEMQTLWRIANA